MPQGGRLLRIFLYASGFFLLSLVVPSFLAQAKAEFEDVFGGGPNFGVIEQIAFMPVPPPPPPPPPPVWAPPPPPAVGFLPPPPPPVWAPPPPPAVGFLPPPPPPVWAPPPPPFMAPPAAVTPLLPIPPPVDPIQEALHNIQRAIDDFMKQFAPPPPGFPAPMPAAIVPPIPVPPPPPAPPPAPVIIEQAPPIDDFGSSRDLHNDNMAVIQSEPAGEDDSYNEVIYGGRSDPTSSQYEQFLVDTEQIDPVKSNILPVESPAQIAPLDPMTMRQSVDVAVSNGQEVLDTKINPDLPTRVWAYSENTASAIELANHNPGELESITLDKGPYGPGGLAHNVLADLPFVKSIANNFGLVLEQDLPAHTPVIVRSHSMDLWSGGSDKDIGQLMQSAVSTFFSNAHAPPDPAEPHTSETHGNVTLEWYG